MSRDYFNGFESSETELYNCLTIVQKSGSNVHRQSLTDSKTGTGCNKCYEGSYAVEFKGGDAVVVFPAVSDSYENTLFKFWYRQNGTTTQNLGNAGTMEVGYVTSATDTTTFVSLETLDEYAGEHCGDFHQIEVECSDIPDDAYIAIRYTMASTGVSWYLDNVSWSVKPDCPQINGTLTYSNVTDESATVSFTDETDEYNSWVLYWRQSGSEDWNTENLSSTSFDLSGLTPSTKYEAYVVRDCGENAEKSNTVTFRTTAVLIEAPFEMTFEDE